MPARRSSERGAALIEILVALALLGVTSAALLGGVLTLARASAAHSQQAKAETILTSAAEALRGADNYHDCAVAADYSGSFAGIDLPTGWTITIQSPILDWNGEQFVDDVVGTAPDFCSNDLLPLQLVTIEVRASDGTVVESVAVVKAEA